jgi:hypothetical protein
MQGRGSTYPDSSALVHTKALFLFQQRNPAPYTLVAHAVPIPTPN